ncbi:MAG: adenosylmethionine decarboxylase [candidate division WOR-3 bacterium]
MRTIGEHYIVEASGCNSEIIGDIERVQHILVKAAEKANVQVWAVSFHRFPPNGVSGVIVISESHLSIHTWPEYGYAALDIYTCGEHANPEEAVNYILEEFKATSVHISEITRGIDEGDQVYYHSIITWEEEFDLSQEKLRMESILKEIKWTKEKEPDKLFEKTVCLLYDNFKHYDWVGIYFINENKLVLGPWKGEKETEHKIIPIGKGICGAAAKEKNTIIVNDVKKDPRYISCFEETKSEIVVPIIKNGEVKGEIDIDSETPSAFTTRDKNFLEKIADILKDAL